MGYDNNTVSVKKGGSVIENNNGSIIVIVIILLALLTLVGITATNMSITESYITRNSAIASQNLYLADMAALVGTRWLIDQSNPNLLDPNLQNVPWMNPIVKKQNPDSPEIYFSNSATPPLSITTDNGTVQTPIGMILNRRGEIDKTNETEKTLRYYFVGWTPSRGNSLKLTRPAWKTGKVIGNYDSPGYGHVEVEMWLQKKF